MFGSNQGFNCALLVFPVWSQLSENFPYKSLAFVFEQKEDPPDKSPIIRPLLLNIGLPEEPPSVTPWPF